jgi:hypothetical protein
MFTYKTFKVDCYFETAERPTAGTCGWARLFGLLPHGVTQEGNLCNSLCDVSTPEHLYSYVLNTNYPEFDFRISKVVIMKRTV